MKKLICAKDVEHAVAAGEHVIYVDASTIITPSARDVAANAGISFSEGCAPTATTAADSAERRSDCWCCLRSPEHVLLRKPG